MLPIRYEKLNPGNFGTHSLDDFIRHQAVREVWRESGGVWRLVPEAFEENWDFEKCRETAADIKMHMQSDQSAFGAFDGSRLVGFVTVSHALFGKTARYAQLACFQVSEPYRGRGIGRALFMRAAEEAKRLGAERLYISAHSSRESQAAYRALSGLLAAEINETLAGQEPCDVQMEYRLTGQKNGKEREV